MATQKGKRVLKRLASGVVGRRDTIPTVLNVPAGGTGAAAGGWDTAVNRDLAIVAINLALVQLRSLGIIK
jgi:hypothetical protein